LESVDRTTVAFIPGLRSVVHSTGARFAALAALAIIVASSVALSMRTGPARLARSPVSIAVNAVDVEPAERYLQPVSGSLTDALIGALTSEAGDRARVLSPLAARELGDKPLDATLKAGIDYVVLLTLRSLGG